MNGVLFAILAAILWGFVPVLDKTALQSGISIYPAILIRAIGSVVIMVMAVIYGGGFRAEEFGVKSVSLLLVAGAIAGGVAMIVYFIALQKIGAARTIPITSIYPLFTIVFSLLILREQFNMVNVFAGTLLIVAGLIILQR